MNLTLCIFALTYQISAFESTALYTSGSVMNISHYTSGSMMNVLSALNKQYDRVRHPVAIRVLSFYSYLIRALSWIGKSKLSLPSNDFAGGTSL